MAETVPPPPARARHVEEIVLGLAFLIPIIAAGLMTGQTFRSPRPMKVLYLLPSLAAGGTERQVVQLIRGLDRSKFLPLLVTIYGTELVPDEIQIPDCRRASLVKPLGKIGNLTALRRLCGLIQRERPDIVQSFLRPADLYLRLACLIVGQPRVVTSLRTRIKGFWSVPWQWTERVLWRASTVIVSNSLTASQEARTLLKVPESRLRVIPNGVDLDLFRPAGTGPEAKSEIGMGQWAILLGMVARYSPVKDHETLLRAVRRLREHGQWPSDAGVLLVGGTTYEETRAQVETRISDWGLQDLCIARGVCPDIAKVYRALDWLVLPSRYEGFPNTVLEAMACGRPVIVSSAANSEGVVTEGRTGFVFPTGDVEALAACLSRALTLSAEQCQAMGRAAREEAERRFSAVVMAERYQALYNELLGKGEPSPCM